MKIKLLLMTLGLATSGIASAQNDAISSSRTGTVTGEHRYSVDFQPLPLLLTPMTGTQMSAASIGGEMAYDAHDAVFAALGGAQGRLTDSQVEDAQDRVDQPVPKKVSSGGLTLGYRHYFNTAFTDSWFASGAASASRSLAQWDRDGERVNESSWAVSPAVEGGYRWLWANGFLLRLGAGASYAFYTTRDYTPVAVTSVQDDVRDLEDAHRVAPLLDLGLGYAF